MNIKIASLLILGILAPLLVVVFRYKIVYIQEPGNTEKGTVVLRQNKTIKGVILNDHKNPICSQQYYLKTDNDESVWLIPKDQNTENYSFEKYYRQNVEVEGEYEPASFCPVESDLCTCGGTIYFQKLNQVKK